ncbi:MAG: 4-hydroxy-tetrahydrodipicolinate synthase, partial [Bacteroidales bacterium]|nr:4-hydroxy-tetrahydrodipicolinate synthase [Bacteroidales bacterium]
MNNRFVLSGCGTALVTPFKDGAVDYQSYASLVERQVEAGIHFLVPLGSTAETPCLEDDEKLKVLELTREIAGDKTILAGVGTNSLKQTLRNMKLLGEHGADMFLVVVPYYNKPTARGQYEYFKAVASETDKPVILYNVPGRTGTNMTAETTLRLAEIENIIAIKEASGDLGQIKAIIEGAPDGFSVLSGNDDQTVDIMKMGGAGVI